MSEDLKEQLEQINREADRIVTGATKLTSIYLLSKETGWDSLHDRRKNHRLIQFCKMVHGLAPDYLLTLVPQDSTHIHSYSTRHNQDL